MSFESVEEIAPASARDATDSAPVGRGSERSERRVRIDQFQGLGIDRRNLTALAHEEMVYAYRPIGREEAGGLRAERLVAKINKKRRSGWHKKFNESMSIGIKVCILDSRRGSLAGSDLRGAGRSCRRALPRKPRSLRARAD